jgi:hypothetical protein
MKKSRTIRKKTKLNKEKKSTRQPISIFPCIFNMETTTKIITITVPESIVDKVETILSNDVSAITKPNGIGTPSNIFDLLNDVDSCYFNIFNVFRRGFYKTRYLDERYECIQTFLNKIIGLPEDNTDKVYRFAIRLDTIYKTKNDENEVTVNKLMDVLISDFTIKNNASYKIELDLNTLSVCKFMYIVNIAHFIDPWNKSKKDVLLSTSSIEAYVNSLTAACLISGREDLQMSVIDFVDKVMNPDYIVQPNKHHHIEYVKNVFITPIVEKQQSLLDTYKIKLQNAKDKKSIEKKIALCEKTITRVSKGDKHKTANAIRSLCKYVNDNFPSKKRNREEFDFFNVKKQKTFDELSSELSSDLSSDISSDFIDDMFNDEFDSFRDLDDKIYDELSSDTDIDNYIIDNMSNDDFLTSLI